LPELNNRARHQLAADIKQAGSGYTHKGIVLKGRWSWLTGILAGDWPQGMIKVI
jgi:hypothetical protein